MDIQSSQKSEPRDLLQSLEELLEFEDSELTPTSKVPKNEAKSFYMNKEALKAEEDDVADEHKSIKFIKTYSQERTYLKKNVNSLSQITKLYFFFLSVPFLGILFISGSLGLSIITIGLISAYIFDLLNMPQTVLFASSASLFFFVISLLYTLQEVFVEFFSFFSLFSLVILVFFGQLFFFFYLQYEKIMSSFTFKILQLSFMLFPLVNSFLMTLFMKHIVLLNHFDNFYLNNSLFLSNFFIFIAFYCFYLFILLRYNYKLDLYVLLEVKHRSKINYYIKKKDQLLDFAHNKKFNILFYLPMIYLFVLILASCASSFKSLLAFKKQLSTISAAPTLFFSDPQNFSSTMFYLYMLKFIITSICTSIFIIYNEQNLLYYYIKKFNIQGSTSSLFQDVKDPPSVSDSSSSASVTEKDENNQDIHLENIVKTANDTLLRVKSVKIHLYKKFLLFNVIFFLYAMSYHHIFDEIKKVSSFSYDMASLLLFSIFMLFFGVLFLLKYMIKLQKKFVKKIRRQNIFSNYSTLAGSDNQYFSSFFSSITISYLKISLFKIIFNIVIVGLVFFICLFVNLPSNSYFIAIFGTFSIIQANLEMSWGHVNRFFLILLGIFSSILTLLNFMALTVYVNYPLPWKEQNLNGLSILNFCIIVARLVSLSSILPVFFKKNFQQDHLKHLTDSDGLEMDEIPSDFLPLSYNTNIHAGVEDSTRTEGSGVFGALNKMLSRIMSFFLSIFSEVGFLFLIFVVFSVELWILESDFSSIKIYSTDYVYPLSYSLLTSSIACLLSYYLWKKKFFRTYVLVISLILASVKLLYYFEINSFLIFEIAVFLVIHVLPLINRPFSYFKMSLMDILVLKNTLVQKNKMKSADKLFFSAMANSLDLRDPQKAKKNFLAQIDTLVDPEGVEEDEDIYEYLDNDEYALYNKYLSKLTKKRQARREKQALKDPLEEELDSDDLEDELNEQYDFRLASLVESELLQPGSLGSSASLNFLQGCIVPSINISFFLSFFWIFLSGIFLLSTYGRNIGRIFYIIISGNEPVDHEYILSIISLWLCFSSIVFFKFALQLKQSSKRNSTSLSSVQNHLSFKLVRTMAIILLVLAIGLFILSIEFFDYHDETTSLELSLVSHQILHIKFYITLTLLVSALYWMRFFTIKDFKSFLFFSVFSSYVNMKILFYYFLPSFVFLQTDTFADKIFINFLVFFQFFIQKFLLVYPLVSSSKKDDGKSSHRSQDFLTSLTTPYTPQTYMKDNSFQNYYRIAILLSMGINFFLFVLAFRVKTVSLHEFSLLSSLVFSVLLVLTLIAKQSFSYNYITTQPFMVTLAMFSDQS